MAIIVDKVQKRKDIALTCKALFVQKAPKPCADKNQQEGLAN